MMPRKTSTTTIEIPTKLLKALMRSDAMELSIVNAEQTAGVTDSPLQQEWQSIADQLSALSHLLFTAHNKTKRRKVNNVVAHGTGKYVREILADANRELVKAERIAMKGGAK